MNFYRYFRIHDVKNGDQLFRGAGICAQQVYEDFRRHLGQKVGIPVNHLNSENDLEREAAFRRLKVQDDWIDDAAIFMIAEDKK